MRLDIRTLAVLLSITSFVQAIVIFVQYLLNRTYKGIGWWALGFASSALGFVLITMRDIISIALIAIVAANSFLFLGLIFAYVGILQFLNKKVYWNRLHAFSGAFIVAVLYYTYIENDVSARAVVISVFFAVLTLRVAYVLFTDKFKSIAFSANFVAGAFLAIGCFFVFRAVVTLTIFPMESYFTPTLMQVSLFLVALITTLVETFGLIIMVNQRLNADIKGAYEVFGRIFNTSPDAAAVARFQDGSIVNVNDGFTVLTGFSREEAVGKTGMSLAAWANPADRENVVKELKEKGYCDNYGAVFKRKDGSLYFGLISAKIIILQGVPHIASFTRDITERKRAEMALEKERERLQKALDEVKTLRGIVPICANCKKIRDDQGYWNQVEKYVGEHSEARFTHGICPDCLAKLYPEYMPDKQ